MSQDKKVDDAALYQKGQIRLVFLQDVFSPSSSSGIE
jgi:hypothetical protein